MHREVLPFWTESLSSRAIIHIALYLPGVNHSKNFEQLPKDFWKKSAKNRKNLRKFEKKNWKNYKGYKKLENR